MACNNLITITKGCDNNTGGIYEAYIIDYDNVTTFTTNTGWTITAMTTAVDFTTFEFKRNVGNVVVEPQISLENGSTFYQATMTLMFHRREAAKSRALNILGEGQRYLGIIFKDANGLYWFLDHAQLTGGSEETGTAKADGSKYTVTFVAQMDNRPYEVLSSVVASVI